MFIKILWALKVWYFFHIFSLTKIRLNDGRRTYILNMYWDQHEPLLSFPATFLIIRLICSNFYQQEIKVVMWPDGEGNCNPLQYSCLENPMDGGAWWAAVHEVAKSQTGWSDFTFTFHFHALEKEMATHSSVLAWRIPGTGEPGGRHEWSDLAAAAMWLA